MMNEQQEKRLIGWGALIFFAILGFMMWAFPMEVVHAKAPPGPDWDTHWGVSAGISASGMAVNNSASFHADNTIHQCYEATLDVDNPTGAVKSRQVPCREKVKDVTFDPLTDGQKTPDNEEYTRHLLANQAPSELYEDLRQRAIEQAEEYMVLVNRLSAERNQALDQLQKSMAVVRQLIDDKADIAGELVTANLTMSNMEFALELSKKHVHFRGIIIVVLLVIIGVFVVGVVYQRHRGDKPDVPFFSSWLKRDLIVKPTIRGDK